MVVWIVLLVLLKIHFLLLLFFCFISIFSFHFFLVWRYILYCFISIFSFHFFLYWRYIFNRIAADAISPKNYNLPLPPSCWVVFYGRERCIVSKLHFDDNSFLPLYSKIIWAESWKRQNTSKTFNFKVTTFENGSVLARLCIFFYQKTFKNLHF